MSLPISVVVKRRYIPPEILAHQKQVKHDKDLKMQIWFEEIHKNLKPLDPSFTAFVKDKPVHMSFKPSSRDISAETLDRNRVACINALRLYDLNHDADMLLACHLDQKRVREEYNA